MVEWRQGKRWFLRRIGLSDACHVNVAPIARGSVHDLDLRDLTFPMANVPACRGQVIAFPAGGAFDDLAVDQQVQAGVDFGVAAADAESDVGFRDGKFRRREGAGRAVTFDFAAGYGGIGRVLNFEFGQQGAGGRAFLERGAGGFPIAIVGFAEMTDGKISGHGGEMRKNNREEQAELEGGVQIHMSFGLGGVSV